MKAGYLIFLVLIALAVSLPLTAQTSAPDDNNKGFANKGFTEVENFEGTVNSTDKLMKLDSTVGYDFNKHFGVFAGLPIYFSNTSSTSTTGTTTSQSGSGLGNFYLGMAFRAPNPALNYGSAITVGAPTGSTKKGLSSGRATVDWSNHFDRSFKRFTPFLDAGLGNTVPDSIRVVRAFTSLGAVGHFEEGAEFELVHHFAIGGSGYEITPFGNQKVFSKLVQQGQTGTTSGKTKGVFQTTFSSSGNGLTRENGVSTWVAFEPTQMVRAQLGYTRSLTFAFNSFTFDLGLNLGKMVRKNETK
ncbi:MAG TPA: hypothetical protein VJA94_21930 [Candidatus Angelobacter sp.]